MADNNNKTHEEHEEYGIVRSYFNDVSRYDILSAKDEKKYALEAKKGSKTARDIMIKSNLRLVIKMAMRYLNRGLTLLDLISEGNIGLMRAVEKFEPKLGFRFSTYATWWVRQTIERAIGNKGRLIRIPGNVLNNLYHIRKEKQKFNRKHLREPSKEELAEIMDMKLQDLEQRQSLTAPIESLDDLLTQYHMQQAIHFHAQKSLEPEKRMQEVDTKRFIEEMLDGLTHTQRQVIIMRYGLMGHSFNTLEEIASQVGLTRERIRQIQFEAIKQLRQTLKTNEINQIKKGN